MEGPLPSSHQGRRRSAALAACLALTISVLVATQSGPARAGTDAWHLDDSFGTGGEVTTKFGDGFDEIFDIAITHDGKTVAVGQTTPNGQSDSDFAIARYKTDGSLDASFGPGGTGMVTTDIGGNDHAGGVAIAADGSIVVVGSLGNLSNNGRPQFALTRYTSGGTPISSSQFDIFGISQANAVAIYPPSSPNAGKILVVGYNRDASDTAQFTVVRLQSDGVQFDTSFGGGDGWAMLPLFTAGHNMANAVAIQSNDKIVIAGTTDQQAFSLVGKLGLIRLNADGSPDTVFGGLGTGWAFDGACTCAGWGVGIRADGAIIVAGQYVAEGEGVNMGGFRYSSAGVFKSLLGADFFGRTDVARDVVFQPGKIVLVGWTAETGDGSTTNDLVHFALARFNNAPETPDNTFGEGSHKLTAAFAFGYDAALAAAVTPEGEIIVGGGSNQAAPGDQDIDFALARFTGAKDQVPGFIAEVYDLKKFTLKAAPETFRVFWRSDGQPGPDVKFDVRSREARFDESKLGPWKTVATKTTDRSKPLKYQSGRTVCFQVRGHSDSFTTPWSDQRCTSIPIDDRTLDRQPRSAWGAYSRSDCYKNTYLGNGGGTGANLHIEAVFTELAVIVAKGPGFGALKVSVNGKVVKKISLQGPEIKCGVLVEVPKSYRSAVRRDVDIEVIKKGDVGSFVDGVGASLI